MHHFELDRKIWEGQIYATLHIRLGDLVAPQVSNLKGVFAKNERGYRLNAIKN